MTGFLPDDSSSMPILRRAAYCWKSFWLTGFLICAAAVRLSAFDTVILDPGHGGHDRGAGNGYVYEKHLALDTARRVAELLKSQGLKVMMTRSTDVFITLDGRSS